MRLKDLLKNHVKKDILIKIIVIMMKNVTGEVMLKEIKNVVNAVVAHAKIMMNVITLVNVSGHMVIVVNLEKEAVMD
jgi:hypothetical protein